MPDISKVNKTSSEERKANRIAAGLPLGEGTPTDAEIVARLRRLVKEMERVDRTEDRRIRNQLRDILDGYGDDRG
jgi:hypothetical protein